MAYTKEGVKWFSSDMQGAPSLTGTAGALIAVLDACLKDGFGLLSVDSIVVSGGVATMTVGAGHLYKQWSVLQIAGVTGALTALNAQWKLKSVTATQAVWDCPGVPDGSAAGTLTAKIAPLGWLKPFSGTNTACYKSNDVNANGHYLAVNDSTTTTSPSVRGYEAMTDSVTGTNPFPTVGQTATGNTWAKANSASARRWLLVGDELFIHWHAAHGANANSGHGGYFGDAGEWTGVTDSYNTLCLGAAEGYATSTGANGPGDFAQICRSTIDANLGYVARAYHGIGGSAIYSPGTFGGWASVNNFAPSGSTSMDQYFPNPLNGSIMACQVMFWDSGVVRGYVPGLYAIMNRVGSVPYAYSQHQILPPGTFADGALAARPVLVVGTGNSATAGGDSPARVLFDILGPWR